MTTESIEQIIRGAGLKVTVPRVCIYEQLWHAEKHHLSAEDLFSRLKKTQHEVGLATIYRVLVQFEAAGLVIKHNFSDDHAIFELSQREAHDHLVCSSCGQVEEFHDEVIESRLIEIAKTHQLALSYHRLIIYGKCVLCLQKSSMS